MTKNIYETEKLLGEYLLFHYGLEKDILPFAFGPKEAMGFHQRCVEFFMKYIPAHRRHRVLDLGCAVGRTSFELSKHFNEVVGLDYSARFIRAARQIKSRGTINFSVLDEGDLLKFVSVSLSRTLRREKVSFARADACRLPRTWDGFDAVVMMNLLDRLKDPRRCLEQLDWLVGPRGFVLIISPYSWHEEFTPMKKWLGGRKVGRKFVGAFECLKEIMRPRFELREIKDLPFLYREHKRKFQWVVAQASLWQKK